MTKLVENPSPELTSLRVSFALLACSLSLLCRGFGPSQVQAFKTKKLAPYDDSLRKFRYGEALDEVLSGGNPAVVAALLEVLVERGGLERALSGRDASGLKPLLSYLCK